MLTYYKACKILPEEYKKESADGRTEDWILVIRYSLKYVALVTQKPQLLSELSKTIAKDETMCLASHRASVTTSVVSCGSLFLLSFPGIIPYTLTFPVKM